MEITHDYMREHFKECTVAMSGSPLYKFEKELNPTWWYKTRRLEFIDLGTHYTVWFECTCIDSATTHYFSSPLKAVTTKVQIDSLITLLNEFEK